MHVMVIPYPAQGHVIPLMEVARCIAINGLKVTFVNTEVTHKKIMSACGSQKDGPNDLIQMVSIPDGMQPWEDRRDLGKLTESISRMMPTKLEELIEGINKTDNKVTCIIADASLVWAIRVAKKMGIRSASFCSSAAAVMALIMSIQKLLEDEIIDRNGIPLKDQMIQLSTTMPFMDPAKFTWACVGNPATNKIIFDILILGTKEAAETADCIICNSTMELETGAFRLFPKMLPIGPLLATNRFLKQEGHFWKEDFTCLTWLDQQPVCSVIYVAFGSVTIFNQSQFEELAFGLELTNKPFLWAVRPETSGSMNGTIYPNGFMDRVGDHGKIVSWAPQQEVLSHPSVACFMSHCGWNSTMEGVSNGVPFLCWPYFADQFLNTTYICDIWKTGLGLKKDDSGIVTRGEIKSKVELLLSNKIIKENALNLKEKVGAERSSNKKLSEFIDWVKKGNVNAPEKNTCN
ncbi:UDP-glycosyltransferase 83A1-like [Cynara cardunculus var. scolymus]|uniref:UDP-glycosyltransferase 83A1-like n=1 Tax=Cynara cardunculus var. scolymus TaxID=59895 RepID=UPI000D62BB73|nr:UDP-glycosyltransferase 83A1-like [Cynara cardunculus var. scolymus]